LSEEHIKQLSSKLGRLWRDPRDRVRIGKVIIALDTKYNLGVKLGREDGVQDVIEQMVERIARAFENLSAVRSKRILDIPSGSKTSRAPESLSVNLRIGKRESGPATNAYTALFEPWFCPIILELGANPVGVDLGDLEGEAFEHYRVDLGQIGALNFFPSDSFDAVQDSRLFGSPEFTIQFPKAEDRLKIAGEIWQQEQRLLKPDGIVIHSDAKGLIGI